MRILHASDLHGHRPAYAAMAELARDPGVDAVVLAGDLLPHPHDRDRLIEDQVEFVQVFLHPWLADLYAARPELPVFAIPGNDDFAAAVAVLVGKGAPDSGLRWLPDGVFELGPYFVAGGPWVPVTPFFMCDFDRFDDAGWAPAIEPPMVVLTDGGTVEVSGLDALRARPTVAAELEALATRSPPEQTIYVVHTPPARTDLDLMRGRVHIGSEALRRFIEAHQPPLTLHGHVHESPGLTGQFSDRIGGTVCINAGASLSGLRALEIELSPGAAPTARRVKTSR